MRERMSPLAVQFAPRFTHLASFVHFAHGSRDVRMEHALSQIELMLYCKGFDPKRVEWFQVIVTEFGYEAGRSHECPGPQLLAVNIGA